MVLNFLNQFLVREYLIVLCAITMYLQSLTLVISKTKAIIIIKKNPNLSYTLNIRHGLKINILVNKYSENIFPFMKCAAIHILKYTQIDFLAFLLFKTFVKW